MKVVYYGNYLTYFEVGRVEFLRQQGLAMSHVDTKVHLPVVEAVVKYRKPARLDDALQVTVSLRRCRHASIVFAPSLLRDGELLLDAEVRCAALEAATFRPRAIPEALHQELIRLVEPGAQEE